MTSKRKFLLFLILSYNGFEDTVACIRSLEKEIFDGTSILVIDNASMPPVTSRLTQEFPGINIISLPENLGWAGGNNVGIKLALEEGYEWICLLNNDTEFPENEVRNFHKSLSKLPPALVHPSIYYWEDPGVPQLNPAHGRQVYQEHELWHGTIPLDHAYGACLAIHRSIFEKVGLFDERFFLQLEETDFYHRARDADYIAVCNPAIKIYHKESKAFGGRRTPIKSYYIARNSLLLIEKRKIGMSAKLGLLKQYYWMITNAAAKDLGRKPGISTFVAWLISSAKHARATRAGILHYATRVFGRIPPLLGERIK